MHEIESQAVAAQQQIGLARTQMTAKQREQRLVRLTLSEMAGLPEDAVVYEGVGKMYVDSMFSPFPHFVCSIPLVVVVVIAVVVIPLVLLKTLCEILNHPSIIAPHSSSPPY